MSDLEPLADWELDNIERGFQEVVRCLRDGFTKRAWLAMNEVAPYGLSIIAEIRALRAKVQEEGERDARGPA